jgi:hypothetical protein
MIKEKGMCKLGFCPLCNGFREVQKECLCGSQMVDSGRVMDYYDDYSAYMDIDQLKLEDGYRNSFLTNKCPHLFTCPICAKDQVLFIDE